jgi:hypothetical protein
MVVCEDAFLIYRKKYLHVSNIIAKNSAVAPAILLLEKNGA